MCTDYKLQLAAAAGVRDGPTGQAEDCSSCTKTSSYHVFDGKVSPFLHGRCVTDPTQGNWTVGVYAPVQQPIAIKIHGCTADMPVNLYCVRPCCILNQPAHTRAYV